MVFFFRNVPVYLDGIQSVVTVCWFPETLACTSTIGEREFCWDFICYTLNIVLCRNISETICFEAGTTLEKTRLYSLIPAWMTLCFTKGHRVTGKLQSMQSFCCQVAWSDSNVHDDWLCKEYDCEEVLYGEYGSFEHLLLLFCLFAVILFDLVVLVGAFVLVLLLVLVFLFVILPKQHLYHPVDQAMKTRKLEPGACRNYH